MVLSTWCGMSPWCRSPVVDVPEGSNIRIEPPGEEGLCSVPFGTTHDPWVVDLIEAGESIDERNGGSGHAPIMGLSVDST